jgi:hypothetical protein
MRKLLFCIYMLMGLSLSAQVDTTSNNLMNELDSKTAAPPGKAPVKIFYSQRLISANTVEVIPKGRLVFNVVHLFGNMAGQFGGWKNAFGLDNSQDIKIGFQLGLTKRLNVIVSRNKGNAEMLHLWEMAFKYKFLEQRENDPSHPLSLTVFTNGVISSMKASTDSSKEGYFRKSSDRRSQVIQVMVARKFGKLFSLQLNPTFVYTNHVVPGDCNGVFALGGGIRVPIYKQFVLIADYFHGFRSEGSKNALRAQNVHLRDVLGVGLELVTPGHVFHMNFTNTTHILENRFIPRTTHAWHKGQYRWGFTISRNFVAFRDKKDKKKK